MSVGQLSTSWYGSNALFFALAIFIYLSQFKDCVFPIVYECLTQQYSALAFYVVNCVLRSTRD